MKFKRIILPLVLVSLLAACSNNSNSESSKNSTSPDSSSSGQDSASSQGSVSPSSSSSTSTKDEDTLLKDALAKLKQDVEYNGTYELSDSVGTYVHEVTAVFAETKYLSRDIYYEESLPDLKYQEANDIVSYEDGSVYYVVHNLDNTVTKIDVTEDYDWSVFQNPFLDIEESDFSLVSTGKYSLDTTKGLDVGIAISGWNHTSCKSFDVEISDSSIRMQFVLDGVDGEVTYDFIASKFGVASVDTEPFGHGDEHDKLGAALASIGENYTMHILDQAYNEYDGDVSQTIYKTETHYFDEFEQIGYRKVDEGIKSYTLTDGVVTKYEDADENNPFVDHLELDTISPEIFEEIEPNVFVLRDLYLAYDVVAAFSNNTDNKLLGYYFALDAKITLTNEGELAKFEYNYDAYSFASHRTVTFEDVDNTVIPGYVQDALEAYEEELQGSTIPAKYIGKFEGVLNYGDTSATLNGSNKLQIEITNNEIIINGLLAEIVEHDDYEGFTLLIDDITYYLGANDYDEPSQALWFADEDYELYCYNIPRVDEFSKDEQDIVIPAKYIGNYEGTLNGSNTINGSNTVVIEITDDKIIINDLVATIDEYDDYEGFTLVVDGVTYYLYTMSYEEEEHVQTMSIFSSDYQVYSYNIERKSEPVESIIPAKFIGKFESVLNDGDEEVTLNGSNKLQIEITSTKIIVNGLEAEIVDYDVDQDFTLSIEGETYYLGDNAYDGQSLWFESEDFEIYCNDVSRVDEFSNDDQGIIIPTRFIGTFEGVLNEGDETITINGSNTLTIEITNTQIIINGIAVEIVEYDPYEDFTISIDGVTYYLGANDYDDPTQGLWFSDEDFTIYCYDINRI